MFEVWLADTVPDWLAGEEVALPEFADSELWLACDPLATPVADEPDEPEPALVATVPVAAWATGA